MRKEMLLLGVLILMFNCDKEKTMQQKIDEINNNINSYKLFIPSSELENLFEHTLNIVEGKELLAYVDKLRDDAFKSDNFTEIDKYTKRVQPAIKVVIGGDANYISANVLYFQKKTKPGSIEHSFFTLTLAGWCDRQKKIHGGVNIFPRWLKQKTGLHGEVDIKERNKLLKKWELLQVKLQGVYLEIAKNTISSMKNTSESNLNQKQNL